MKKVILLVMILVAAGATVWTQPFVSVGFQGGPGSHSLSGSPITSASYSEVPSAVFDASEDDLIPDLLSGYVKLGYRFEPFSAYASLAFLGTSIRQDTSGSTSSYYTGIGSVTAHDYLSLDVFQLVPMLNFSAEYQPKTDGAQVTLFAAIGGGVSIPTNDQSLEYLQATDDWPYSVSSDSTPSPDYDTVVTLNSGNVPKFAFVMAPELGIRTIFSGNHGISLTTGAYIYLTPITGDGEWRVQDSSGNALLLTLSEAVLDWYIGLEYIFFL